MWSGPVGESRNVITNGRGTIVQAFGVNPAGKRYQGGVPYVVGVRRLTLQRLTCSQTVKKKDEEMMSRYTKSSWPAPGHASDASNEASGAVVSMEIPFL